MKRATKANTEPTRSGGSVRHSARTMLSYQRGALSDSAVYAATSSTARAMLVTVETSTIADRDPPPRAAGSGAAFREVTVDPAGVRRQERRSTRTRAGGR